MFNIFRVWLIALGVLLSGQSRAIDYYWMVTTSVTTSINTAHYSSPPAACDAILNYFVNANTSVNWRIESLYRNSNTSYGCLIYRQPKSGGAWTQQGNYGIVRNGDTCPVDTTYNSSTGLCDAPEQSLCEQVKDTSQQYVVHVQFVGAPVPDTVDVDGCLAKFDGGTDGIVICGNQTDGSATCTGIATFTGEESTSSVPVAGSADECTYNCMADFPQTESSELPCDPATDPTTGASVCTSESHFSEPGTMTCGTANGELVCTENPKSRSQDKTVETTTSTTTNSDGSTSTTTTTTTNKTDCVGINGCTSSTTTETKTGGTNADGSAKSDTTSCTGEGCTAPEDLPQEQSAPLPSGELQQPAERGNFTDELAEWDQMIADSRVDLRSKLDQMAELVTAETALSLSDSSGQLYCQSVTLPGLGSSFDICLDDYQDELAGIKWILIFMATVLAFYIIFVRD